MNAEDSIKSYLKSEKIQSRNINELILSFLETQAKEDDNEINNLLFTNLILQYSAAERKLTELNQLKNKFLGMASHDLRNPLSSMKGFSEILLSGDEDIGELNDAQKELVTTINRSCNDLLSLLNNLLDVSMIESGKFRINIKDESIKELLQERVKLNRVIAEKKEISIREDFAEMPNGLFDRERILQVVDNLISNAIKFSPLGSEIRVSLLKEGENALIKVKDEGPGISPEDQDKLFGEFQKVGTKTTGGEKSTGLGLSIVKRIIEAHNGTIKVSSALGAGSEFMFTLPLSKTQGSEDQRELKILVVDNLNDNCALIKSYLKDSRFKVETAENGKVAYEKVIGGTYDLVFIDVKMPVMDGHTATREIRKWEKENGKTETPIIALTSLDFIDDRQKSMDAGCNEHLTKPVDKKALLSKILEYTGKAIPLKKGAVEPVSATKPLNILYAEDDGDNRALILAYLKKLPYKIDIAMDGKAAYEKFAVNKYDIVLMDVEMPVMDGYSASKNIRKLEKDTGAAPTPVIMLTAHELDGDDKKKAEAGYDGYVAKPVKKTVLLETIQSFTQG